MEAVSEMVFVYAGFPLLSLCYASVLYKLTLKGCGEPCLQIRLPTMHSGGSPILFNGAYSQESVYSLIALVCFSFFWRDRAEKKVPGTKKVAGIITTGGPQYPLIQGIILT